MGDIPKSIATTGKEPAVKALPKRTAMVTDAYGRNTPTWLPEVAGRAEGPLSVVVAFPQREGAREYFSREEALVLAASVMDAVEAYDKQVTL